jgi:hypothetical protein
MNNKLSKYLFSIIVFLLFFPIKFRSQNFTTIPLIEIPGNNYDIDILSSEFASPNADSYICWINELDSIYTVFLKQLGSSKKDIITVISDSIFKSNPQIIPFKQGVKIFWQSKKNNHWKVCSKNYYELQLGNTELIMDSLIIDPQISVSMKRIAWIDDGNLLFAEFDNDMHESRKIDSLNCLSPNLYKYNYDGDLFKILYLKEYDDSLKVILAEYNDHNNPTFTYRTISPGNISSYPKFGMNWSISFQTYNDNVWKCFYNEPFSDSMKLSNNKTCNFNNPIYFSYNHHLRFLIHLSFFLVN